MPLENPGRAYASGRDDDCLSVDREGLPSQPSSHAGNLACYQIHLFYVGPGPEIAASSHGFIQILGRAPLGATAAAQHALRPAIEAASAGDVPYE